MPGSTTLDVVTPEAVRTATAAELSALRCIEAASDALYASAGIGALPAGSTDFSSCVAVLVTGTPPVGFCALTEVDGNAHLLQLSVHPSYGRQGLGTALLRAAIAWARHRGYGMMTLTTFVDVPWNAPFYARHGWEVTEPTPALHALRRREAELGLDRHGPRVAMTRRVT